MGGIGTAARPSGPFHSQAQLRAGRCPGSRSVAIGIAVWPIRHHRRLAIALLPPAAGMHVIRSGACSSSASLQGTEQTSLYPPDLAQQKSDMVASEGPEFRTAISGAS